MILLAAAGALSMVGQVVVLRELVAALYGVELLYVLALGAWLAGTGLGAAAGRLAALTPRGGRAACIALGLWIPLELAALRTAGPLSSAVPGAYLPFPSQLGWIAAATLPPAMLCGLLFPVLSRLAAAARGLSVGRSYAVESAGAAAGGVGVTAAFSLGASTFQVAALAPAIGVVAVIASAAQRSVSHRALASCVAALPFGAVALLGGAWDVGLLRRSYPALLDAADTPHARVVLTGRDSQVAVYENGAFAFDSEGLAAEAFADLAALQHARPGRALVIGGGGEGVPDALARHGLAAIDNVEVDGRAYALVRAHTGVWPNQPAAETTVRLHVEEPRRFLQNAGPYDLILVAAGEPVSGASSRFYTREFFTLCARRLTRDGVLAIRLAAAENVWPAPLVRRTASIVAALRGAFPAVECVPGSTLYIFASSGPLPVDDGVLAARLSERGLKPRLISPPYLHYLYTNDRRQAVHALLKTAEDEPPNTDEAPVCYRYAALAWLAAFFPSVAAPPAPGTAERGWMWWAGAGGLALAAAAWLRRRHNRRVALGLFAVGAIGMLLETVLLLRFQIANGVVYQQVGWLLTCFMGGMAAGGWAGGGGAAPSRQAALSIPAASVTASLLVVVAVALLPQAAGIVGTSLLLAASGAAVGGAFAASPALWHGGAARAAPALYAADVVGGAAGAIAATLVLVPAAGLVSTAGAALGAAVALAVVIPRCGPAGR